MLLHTIVGVCRLLCRAKCITLEASSTAEPHSQTSPQYRHTPGGCLRRTMRWGQPGSSSRKVGLDWPCANWRTRSGPACMCVEGGVDNGAATRCHCCSVATADEGLRRSAGTPTRVWHMLAPFWKGGHTLLNDTRHATRQHTPHLGRP